MSLLGVIFYQHVSDIFWEWHETSRNVTLKANFVHEKRPVLWMLLSFLRCLSVDVTKSESPCKNGTIAWVTLDNTFLHGARWVSTPNCIYNFLCCCFGTIQDKWVQQLKGKKSPFVVRSPVKRFQFLLWRQSSLIQIPLFWFLPKKSWKLKHRRGRQEITIDSFRFSRVPVYDPKWA